MAALPTFAEFEARAEGCDEVLERRWAPGTVLDTHTQPFAVRAIVTYGEMWLTCDGTTLHLHAGDRFELARDVPHAERYGADGRDVRGRPPVMTCRASRRRVDRPSRQHRATRPRHAHEGNHDTGACRRPR